MKGRRKVEKRGCALNGTPSKMDLGGLLSSESVGVAEASDKENYSPSGAIGVAEARIGRIILLRERSE